MQGKSKTIALTYSALMTALAILLSYFPEIPLAFFAPWLKLDFSFTPLLLLGFSVGPGLMALALLVTNLVHIIGGTTSGVGELANLIIGIALLMPPVLMYRQSRTRRSALLGMAVGVVLMIVAAMASNLFILLRRISGRRLRHAAGMGMTPDLSPSPSPFQLAKGSLAADRFHAVQENPAC